MIPLCGLILIPLCGPCFVLFFEIKFVCNTLPTGWASYNCLLHRRHLSLTYSSFGSMILFLYLAFVPETLFWLPCGTLQLWSPCADPFPCFSKYHCSAIPCLRDGPAIIAYCINDVCHLQYPAFGMGQQELLIVIGICCLDFFVLIPLWNVTFFFISILKAHIDNDLVSCLRPFDMQYPASGMGQL